MANTEKITIPTRTSSKRAASRSVSQLRAERSELRTKQQSFGEEQNRLDKKIKTSHKWTKEHWWLQAERYKLRGRLNRIQSQLDLLEKGKDIDDSEVERIGLQDMSALSKLARICREHAERLQSNFGRLTYEKRSYWTYYGKTHGLLDPKAGQGSRTTSLQSNLRAQVIKSYDLLCPDGTNRLWDPFTSEWVRDTKAAHLIPSSVGENDMATIFGWECRKELHTPFNCVIMSVELEKTFDKHLWSVVPDIPEPHTPNEIRNWHRSEVKEYRIRVNCPDHQDMNQVYFIRGEGRRLRDLHGKKVEFRNDFRPRARYLYLHYCTAVLKHDNYHDVIRNEGQKQKFWGSVGGYYQKSFLVGMTEIIGHEYEWLFKDEDDDLMARDLGVNNNDVDGDSSERPRIMGPTILVQSLTAKDENEDETSDEWITLDASWMLYTCLENE